MTTRNALFSALILASMGLMACPTTNQKVDGGTDAGSGECIDATDCADPQLFWCNPVTSKCEPSCRSKEQCSASVRGTYALDFCSGTLGCECDEGKCVASLCSADSDCGATGACRSGACVSAPALTTVAKCQVTPDLVVLKKGATAKFWVSTWDASNNPVVVKEGATWAAATGGLMTGSGTGASATFTAATVSTGTTSTASVEATVGTAKCTAKAVVITDVVAADSIAVVVMDELSGRPVGNIDVVASKPDGTVIAQAAAVKTDAKGFATLALGGNTTVSVTAFGPDHAWVTIANYNTAAAGASKFLSIVTRRNQADKFGGYKGAFKNVPVNSNVHAALGGMSLAGSITSLSLTQLLGPSVPTDIKIGSAINQMGVPIPAGVFLGFGEQTFKKDIAGQGLAGVCYDASGAVDEAKTGAGECGVRTAWALAGDVPLGDLPIDAVAGGLNNINIGELLGRILPIFKKFNSSVVRDVSFSLKNTPKDASGKYVFSDQSSFATADHDFTQVPLAFSFAAKLPDLPKFRGTYVDGAAIIGGANVPGRGVVPLGIGVGVNTDGNAQIDKQGVYTSPGLVQMRMAPTHHGLEGAEYGLVVAAISAKALTDASAGIGASAIFARVPDNKLVFDPTGTQKIDVSALSFPIITDGAKFNYADANYAGIPQRSFRLVNSPALDLAGINVIRVSFADDLDRRWDVVVDPATLSSTAGFTLPAAPAGMMDRLFANGMSTGTRSGMVVQALRMNTTPATTGGAAVSFVNFVEFNSTNADRTTDFLTGFSFLDVGVPGVSFTTPKDNPATITKGTTLALKASRFKIGTTADADGVVKLSFLSGTAPAAGCVDVFLELEKMPGNGVLEHTLPMTCVGANITVKAELFHGDKAHAIAPAVSSSTVVTIN